MAFDRYTKLILTVIAAALVALALQAWGPAGDPLRVPRAEAQAPVPPAAAPAQPIPAPPSLSGPWWEDCAAVSSETVPADWGRLVGVAPGAFVFESDDTIRLVRTAPYEAVSLGKSGKPCKMLEIRRKKPGQS
jgi:hypothetical protein